MDAEGMAPREKEGSLDVGRGAGRRVGALRRDPVEDVESPDRRLSMDGDSGGVPGFFPLSGRTFPDVRLASPEVAAPAAAILVSFSLTLPVER